MLDGVLKEARWEAQQNLADAHNSATYRCPHGIKSADHWEVDDDTGTWTRRLAASSRWIDRGRRRLHRVRRRRAGHRRHRRVVAVRPGRRPRATRQRPRPPVARQCSSRPLTNWTAGDDCRARRARRGSRVAGRGLEALNLRMVQRGNIFELRSRGHGARSARRRRARGDDDQQRPR